MNSDFDLAGRLAPLRTLVLLYGDQDVAVFEVAMGGLADTRGVTLWPERWERTTAPAKGPTKKKTPAGDGSETEGSLGSSGAEGWSSSSGPGLCTDAETEECDSSEAGDPVPEPEDPGPPPDPDQAPVPDLEAVAAAVVKHNSRKLQYTTSYD